MSYRTLGCALGAVVLASSFAHAVTIRYWAPLGPEASGASGSGVTNVTFDTTANTMRVEATFSGLSGTTTASHIHGPTAAAFTGNAGVATQTPTFSAFPLGVQAGSFDQTFDMTQAGSYNAAFLNSAANGGNTATAFNSLMTHVAENKAYLNIHTSTFGGGEIRGYYRVPEPTTLTALLGAALVVRRRR